jgi:hypothetical protein
VPAQLVAQRKIRNSSKKIWENPYMNQRVGKFSQI